MAELTLNSVEEAIADFRDGKFVIVVDDEDRENEGDLIIAAEKITAEKVTCPIRWLTTPRCWALPSPLQWLRWKDAQQASPHTTVLRPSKHWPTRRRSLKPSADPDISTRCMPKTTAYCAGADTPKRPSTYAEWLVYIP